MSRDTEKNELVFVKGNEVVTDSLTIAEMFGKRHDHVLRDIKSQIELAGEEFSSPNFGESKYEARGKEYPKYDLTEEAFTLVVFSYNTKEAVQTKIKFIQEFKRLKEELRKPKVLTDREQRVEALKLTLEHEEKLVEYDGRLSKLEDNVRIDSFEQNALQKQIKKRVYKVFETANPNGLDLKKLFPCIHRNFRDAFGVPTYRDLRKLDYEEAISWVKTWRPLI